MTENPKYVVIPWELAVSLDETLDMDLRMASIYDGDDIDGSGVDYGDEAEGILEDRKALRKAMAKAMEDELTPDLFNQNGIVWHPYPKEKPTEEKEYLISFYDCTRERHDVDFDFYNPGHDVWDVYDDVLYTKVYAWAEKPKPYQPEVKDDKS